MILKAVEWEVMETFLRTSTTTIFDWQFFRVMSKKNKHPGMPHCTFFSPEKLVLLPLLEDVKPPPNRKMIKLFKRLITCFHHYDILAKTCKTKSRMTTAIAFSRQNDAHRHRHHVSSTVEINTGSFQRNPKLTSEICSCVIIRVCIEIIAITS